MEKNYNLTFIFMVIIVILCLPIIALCGLIALILGAQIALLLLPIFAIAAFLKYIIS